MRLVKYLHKNKIRLGVRVDDGLVADSGFADLRQFLETPAARRSEILTEASGHGRPVRPEKLLAPVAERCQIIYTGGNYASHLAEVAHLVTPKEPVFFPGLWSSVIGPGDPIAIPEPDSTVDYEVELAFVISKTASKVKASEAWDYVYGYTLVNDVSARDVMQREAMQIMLCKSPDTFCPVGPEIVSRDEIADVYGLRITSTVNGVLKQDSTTGTMLTRIPELLEFLSRTVTLQPGDVVTTGTPGGAGAFRNPPEFMSPGDTVTVAVEQIGELTNPLVAGWLQEEGNRAQEHEAEGIHA